MVVRARGSLVTRSLGERLDDGRLRCDFCGQLNPVVYYECANFQIVGDVSGVFDSGDRFYACDPRRSLIDAGESQVLAEAPQAELAPQETSLNHGTGQAPPAHSTTVPQACQRSLADQTSKKGSSHDVIK